MTIPKSRGFMYIARRPCGKISAAAWDDPGCEKNTASFIERMIDRGEIIERIERFDGDPMLPMICWPGHDCQCMKKNRKTEDDVSV